MTVDHLSAAALGFVGKLPKHGDFVQRGLCAEFLDVWEAWLPHVLNESREQLGQQWLEAYRFCPIWRFVLGPGIVGDRAWAGAFMSSIDKVGRYFPLTVAQPLPPTSTVFAALLSASAAHTWFEPLEAAMLDILGHEGLDAAGLESALAHLDNHTLFAAIEASDGMASQLAQATGGRRWNWSVHSGIDAADWLLCRHASTMVDDIQGPASAWLVPASSDNRMGELLVVPGLPDATLFAGMLTGYHAPLGEETPDAPVAPPVDAEFRTEAPQQAAASNRPDGDQFDGDTVPESRRAAHIASGEDLDATVREELARMLGD